MTFINSEYKLPGMAKARTRKFKQAKKYLLVRYGRMNTLGLFEHRQSYTPKVPTRVVVKTEKGLELGYLVGQSGCYRAGHFRLNQDQIKKYFEDSDIDFDEKPDYTITGPDVELTGPSPPDLLTSDVTTVVTVPDNHTIILGGLEKLDQSKGGTKVPLLGDVPIVGGLFRSTLDKDEQSRLYVFVKAHIIRPGEELTGTSDIEVVSQSNRDRFEKYEREMQEYEDWPGIKPTPLDPVRILEAD